MPKFAANLTWLFQEHEFPDRFDAAGALGFAAAECQFPYAWDAASLAARCSRAGLTMLMFNTPGGRAKAREYGLPGRQSEFRESVLLALEYAVALDCRMLHMLAGILPAGRSRDECLEVYVDNLRWAAERCAAADVTVLVEPINTIERPGYLISTTGEAAEAIGRAGAPNVAMQFDFHNVQLMEGALTRALETHFGSIRHMQIAGVPDRTPPDRGEINYRYLFELVDRLGYAGWLGCEFRAGEHTAEGLRWASGYGIG